MAQNSEIDWTDHTFNPWLGCTNVSLGVTLLRSIMVDAIWASEKGKLH
jgi:protein gp37